MDSRFRGNDNRKKTGMTTIIVLSSSGLFPGIVIVSGDKSEMFKKVQMLTLKEGIKKNEKCK